MLCSAQAYDIDGGIQNIQLGNFIKYNSDGSEIAEGDEEREANYYKIKVEGSAFQGKNLIDEKALNEFKGEPIMQPTVAIEKADEEGVTYVFTFTTKPEVKIKKYTGLNVKKDDVKVTAKDVE